MEDPQNPDSLHSRDDYLNPDDWQPFDIEAEIKAANEGRYDYLNPEDWRPFDVNNIALDQEATFYDIYYPEMRHEQYVAIHGALLGLLRRREDEANERPSES